MTGTWLKAASGIAGLSIVILGGLSVLSGLFTKFFQWSPSNIRSQAAAVLMQGEMSEDGVLVICTIVILSLLFVTIATINFRRFEQF